MPFAAFLLHEAYVEGTAIRHECHRCFESGHIALTGAGPKRNNSARIRLYLIRCRPAGALEGSDSLRQVGLHAGRSLIHRVLEHRLSVGCLIEFP